MIASLVGRIRVGARSDFAKSSLLVFVALVLASVFYYGFYLVIGHTLTVAAYGTVMSLISVSMLASTPAAIGQTIIAKIVAQRATLAYHIPSEFALRTTLGSVAAALAIVLVGFIWQTNIAEYLALDGAQAVPLTAVATALCVLLFAGRGLLQGARQFKAFAISNVLDGVLRFVLVLFLAQRFGVEGALWALVLGLAIAVGYGAIVAVRSTTKADANDSERNGRVPSAVVGTGVISFALIALGYYDPILVKHYLPSADAGIYGVLSLAGRTVAIILSFVPIVLLPHVTERTGSGHSSRGMLGMALSVSIAVGVCATVGCAAAAPFALRVLAGPSFGAAIPLLAMYVAGASFLALANVLAAYLIGKHDYRVVAPVCVAAAAEIAAVVWRHANVRFVVQDVAVGHAAVASVMFVGLLARRIGSDNRRSMTVAA